MRDQGFHEEVDSLKILGTFVLGQGSIFFIPRDFCVKYLDEEETSEPKKNISKAITPTVISIFIYLQKL